MVPGSDVKLLCEYKNLGETIFFLFLKKMAKEYRKREK
jgi:hypothetical protein